MTVRSVAVRVTKRNGAYLIAWNETQENWTMCSPHELFEASATLRVAKALAASGAVDLGWLAPYDWGWCPETGAWELTATDPSDVGD